MNSKFGRCVQINLCQKFGGGEVFTAFMARALNRIQMPSVFISSRSANFWSTLELGQLEWHQIESPTRLLDFDWHIDDLVVFQGGVPLSLIPELRRRVNKIIAYVHLPYHERSPEPLVVFDRVCPVSGYVRDTLLAKGLVNVHREPCLGAADLQRGIPGEESRAQGVRRASIYDWDKRKVRERVFSWFEPFFSALRTHPVFEKPPGLVLGVVSRIATIKQFPQLFEALLPVLLKYPDVHVCIFGSGGYASIRDLKQVVQPLGKRVSLWGHQTNVRQVYAQIDWLLSGLPEKEALGLNIIEAQQLGVPVLAVDAPPFNETVCHGVSGLLYVDPRLDGGQDFERCLAGMLRGEIQFEMEQRETHLKQFSEEAFAERLARLVVSL